VLTIVYIIGRAGGRYATTVDAESTHGAVRKAIGFFSDPFWRGPRPSPDSEYVVSPVYDEQRSWRVRAKDLNSQPETAL
jgi:hypothetical protein